MAILLLHSFLFTLDTSNQKSISWLLLVQSNLYFVAWLTDSNNPLVDCEVSVTRMLI